MDMEQSEEYSDNWFGSLQLAAAQTEVIATAQKEFTAGVTSLAVSVVDEGMEEDELIPVGAIQPSQQPVPHPVFESVRRPDVL